jgi:hypothetical protein
VLRAGEKPEKIGFPFTKLKKVLYNFSICIEGEVRSMRGCPCKNCLERELGCHGTCADYKRWAKENEKAKHKKFLAEEVVRYQNEEHTRLDKYIRSKRR